VLSIKRGDLYIYKLSSNGDNFENPIPSLDFDPFQGDENENDDAQFAMSYAQFNDENILGNSTSITPLPKTCVHFFFNGS
jgi:hypothetical protein